ncbi:MAG: SH3 domain-containing protein [Chloroflexota bacterium]
MDGPEDKGPRYRLVMFVAIAAIVGPGLFLLNWIGDNGVNNLFRSLVGLDQPRPRVTRTATPAGTIVAVTTSAANPTGPATVTFTSTVVPSPAATALATAQPVRTTAPTSQATLPPTATRTLAPSATNTPRPPTATPTLKPQPTPTPKTNYLGRGVAVPAYGGAAVVRAKPNTDAEALASIPLDDQVLVLRLVEGEAIDPVESRWWEVDYGDVHGFVYYKLIKLQE